jgi:hypothetical protein
MHELLLAQETPVPHLKEKGIFVPYENWNFDSSKVLGCQGNHLLNIR